MIRSLAIAGLLAGSAFAAIAQPVSPVRWTCGGIGSDERRILEEHRAEASVELMFVTRKRGGYLAGANVSLQGGSLAPVTFEAEGPICLVELPPGTYRIEATLDGVKVDRKVTVRAAQRGQRAVFAFPDPPSDGIEASEEEKRQARQP